MRAIIPNTKSNNKWFTIAKLKYIPVPYKSSTKPYISLVVHYVYEGEIRWTQLRVRDSHYRVYSCNLKSA